jgi:hypothetical protein
MVGRMSLNGGRSVSFDGDKVIDFATGEVLWTEPPRAPEDEERVRRRLRRREDMSDRKAKIQTCCVRIQCACGSPFVADLDDIANFARCPSCDDVVWIEVEATVHEIDAVEHPDADMIAQGRVEESATGNAKEMR